MVITGQYSSEWLIEILVLFVFCGGLIDIYSDFIENKKNFLELIRLLTATAVHWGVPRQEP